MSVKVGACRGEVVIEKDERIDSCWTLGPNIINVKNVPRFWDVRTFHDMAYKICNTGEESAEIREQLRDNLGCTWGWGPSLYSKVHQAKSIKDDDIVQGSVHAYHFLFHFIVHDLSFCVYLPDSFLVMVSRMLSNFPRCNEMTLDYALNILLALALPNLDSISVSSFSPALSAVVSILGNEEILRLRAIVPALMMVSRLIDYEAALVVAIDSNVIEAVLSLVKGTKSVFKLALMTRILYKLKKVLPTRLERCTDAGMHFNTLVLLASTSTRLDEVNTTYAVDMQLSVLGCLQCVVPVASDIDIECFVRLWSTLPDNTRVRGSAVRVCAMLLENSRLSNRALNKAHWEQILLRDRTAMTQEELAVIHTVAVRAQSHATKDDSAISNEIVSQFAVSLTDPSVSAFKTVIQLFRCLESAGCTHDVIGRFLPAFKKAVGKEGPEVIEPAITLLSWWITDDAQQTAEAGKLLVEVLQAIHATGQYHLYDAPCRLARIFVKGYIEATVLNDLVRQLVLAHPMVTRRPPSAVILECLKYMKHHGTLRLEQLNSELRLQILDECPSEPPIGFDTSSGSGSSKS
eukprot:TRINITY_DN2488_c0_g1_i1.p1 TRINITY_DN2488_c0_g1~~TRINITY_DN2488_c0_g1_i1.p1  ORF type:complete len:575 (+),score=110.76 TRINITY_DN2488_c0_g1_i1:914-2638(+)